MASNSIWDQPALEPPPGVVPDFANASDSHASSYGILISSSALCLVALLARLISSASKNKFAMEDALMFAALGMLAGLEYVSYDAVMISGLDTHQWDIQLKSLPHFLHQAHLGSIFYSGSIMLIKVAILASWLHLFVPARHQKTFWVLHALIWTNVIFYMIAMMTELFRCWPREKIWNPLFQGGHCPIDVKKQYIAASAVNVLSDSAILAVPQSIIWKLQMPRAKRWGLSLLFVIGLGAWTFGITRMVYLIEFLTSDDVVYIMPKVGIWSVWEVTAGFLILGIPAMPAAARALHLPIFVASITRCFSPGRGQQPLSPVTVPQWQLYKPRSRRRRRGPWEISDLESHDMGTLGTADASHNPAHSTSDTTATLKSAAVQSVDSVHGLSDVRE